MSEAADVFAWLMHLQTVIDLQHEGAVTLGAALNEQFFAMYPDRCQECGRRLCLCPAVLPSTLGRIAKESPAIGSELFRPAGILVRADEAIAMFEIGDTEIALGSQRYRVDEAMIAELRNLVLQINRAVTTVKFTQVNHGVALLDAVYSIRQLLESQRITQQALDELSQAFASLPSEERESFRSLLTSLGAGVAVEAGKYLLGSHT